MVHSTSDSTNLSSDELPSRTARVSDGGRAEETQTNSETRAARFLRGPSETDEAVAETAPMRRATYRPPEAIARLRDVVTTYRDALRDEADRSRPSDPEYRELIRAAAQCEEVVGAPRRAAELLSTLAGEELDGAVERVRRRVIRRANGDLGSLLESLDRARDATDAADATEATEAGDGSPEHTLLMLEAAGELWANGAPADEVLERLDALEWSEETGDWVLLWEAELRTDALLEEGRTEAAKIHLVEALEHAEADDVRACLAGRAAVWAHISGRPEQAQSLLEPFFDTGELPGDLARLLLDLGRETGMHIDHELLLERYDLPPFIQRAVAIERIHRLEDEDGLAAAARRALRAVSQHGDDRTILQVARTYLERLEQVDAPGTDDATQSDETGWQNGSVDSTDLLDVLNRLVEVTADPVERVEQLVRLGHLYEEATGLEGAAADVYREALELNPTSRTALQALGRLYNRRHNWSALAELYRHELRHNEEPERAWRLNLRLARLLEERLGQPEDALEHYLRVVDSRGWDLSALKGAARQLADLNRFRDLAELFVESVEQAPSDREAVYLLTRAAELAEERLGAADFAIAAWQQVLEIDPGHPVAYSSLGQLLSAEGRWKELVELNLRELHRAETVGKTAELLTRSADIVANHLGDPQRAIDLYRSALQESPDHLPALEGLGRLLGREGRWEDIEEMTLQQLSHLPEGSERRARLCALAHLLENRLGDIDGASEIWRDMLEANPEDDEARAELLRLTRSAGNWHEACELLEAFAARREGAERSAALGEMAQILEFHVNAPDAACAEYLRALEADATQLEWLDGVSRTWPPSRSAPGEVADQVEDLLMQEMPGEVRDAYFKVLGRLRERSETDAEASRGYRMHGSRDSRENQTVLRFAMAGSGERDQLRQSRRTSPHHPLEWLAFAPRTRLSDQDRDRLDDHIDVLGDAERAFLLGELPAKDGAAYVDAKMPADLRLGTALVRLLDGEKPESLDQLGEADGSAEMSEYRLGAELGRGTDNFEEYLRWTLAECRRRKGRNGAVERLIDAAVYARRDDRFDTADRLHLQAATIAFPCLAEEDLRVPSDPDAYEGEVAQSTLENLYDSIRASEQWELLKQTTQAHVAKDGLTAARRVQLFEQLADVLQHRLDEPDGARRAVSHCWQLSERPEFLRRLVLLDGQLGDREEAIRHQRRHFDVTSRGGRDETAVVQSGIWLADLLLADPEDLDEGIELLEMLRESCGETRHSETLMRMLAYAYADADRPYDAVDAFQRVLKFEVIEDELDDWRELIGLYEHRLDDPQTAYSLQWRVIHSFPRSERDLDKLVDLAGAAGEQADCVEQLEQLAKDQENPASAASLLNRAARLADETLDRPERAVQLLDEVLETDDTAGAGSEERSDVMRRRVRCLARSMGREREAVDAFRQLLEVAPFEPDTYAAILEVFEREQAHDRARLTRQVLTAIDGREQSASPRTKKRPARPIDEDVVENFLLPDELSPAIFHLLRQTMPLAGKVFSDRLPQGKVLQSNGLTIPGSGDLAPVIDQAMQSFELGKYHADSADNAPPRPQILAGSSPEIWFSSDQLAEMSEAELRFSAGWSAAVAWSELAPVLSLDGRDVWHLVEGTWLRHHGSGFQDCVDLKSQQIADAIGSPFLTMARRRVVRATEPVVETIHDAPCELWPDAVEEFAARAGLVLSGNLSAAIRSILRFRGWNLDFDAPETRKRISRTGLIERLVRFAYSDAYLEARYALGLSGRPSEVGVR